MSVLALACAIAGCRYDIDKIYRHQATEPQDEVPAQLVDLWTDQAFSTVDDTCRACFEQRCATENTECRDDPECVAFTRCVAESTDPVTMYECRARHAAWLSEEIDVRDVSGPLGQCLFQDACSEECGSRTNFQCLHQFSWPTTGAKTVPFRVRFIEARSLELVSNMDIKVCRPDDLYCVSPISTARTDKNGEVQLELPVSLRAFQGYLELSREGLYPTLLRFGWPISREGVTNTTVINEESVNLNIALAGVEPDAERGLLQLRAFTCAGVGAADIEFTSTGLDDSSRTWYANSIGIPSFSAKGTAPLGAGGIINVLEGLQTVTARRLEDGKVVSETAAPVRKGHMTIVVLAPLGTDA